MGQLKTDVAVLKQGNLEVQNRLDVLTELIKKEILGRSHNMEDSVSQMHKAMDGTTVVSSQPQTPTHIATMNSPVNTSDIIHVRSINWEGSNKAPFNTPLHSSSTVINPSSTAGFFVTQPQILQSSVLNPSFTIPTHNTPPPFQQQLFQSTLNPFLLYHYIHVSHRILYLHPKPTFPLLLPNPQ